jgi:hypothetical protein
MTNVRNGSSVLIAGDPVELRLFGRDFTPGTVLAFTTKEAERGIDCTDMRRETDPFKVEYVTSFMSLVTVTLPKASQEGEPAFYICLKEANATDRSQGSSRFVHQGTDFWLRIYTEPKPERTTLLPLWLQITIIVVLLCFSGLFSGLNLGLNVS